MSQDIPIHVIVVKETNTSARPDGSSKSAYSAHIFAGDTLKSRERLMSTQRKLTEESSLEMLLEMVQEPLVFMLSKIHYVHCEVTSMYIADIGFLCAQKTTRRMRVRLKSIKPVRIRSHPTLIGPKMPHKVRRTLFEAAVDLEPTFRHTLIIPMVLSATQHY